MLLLSGEKVKDVVRATDGHKLADFLGESEGVVLCGRVVLGVLHVIFVLVRCKDANGETIYHLGNQNDQKGLIISS